jgi:hypothetical protein
MAFCNCIVTGAPAATADKPRVPTQVYLCSLVRCQMCRQHTSHVGVGTHCLLVNVHATAASAAAHTQHTHSTHAGHSRHPIMISQLDITRSSQGTSPQQAGSHMSQHRLDLLLVFQS